MLVLFETPAGYSLFKVSNEKKISKTDPDDIYDTFFQSAEKTKSIVNLVSFQPFSDTADAVSAATACMEGKVNKSLKSFLKKQVLKKKTTDDLAVADKNLAVSIKEKLPNLGCSVLHNAKTQELFRGIRCYMEDLLEEGGGGDTVSPEDIRSMQLGLSHSLSRYKLKFSADKVDTMVIQAVGLLDELDKEINTYAMRVKEWYGWHFPEMQSILPDNVQYSKVVLNCGFRTDIKHDTDLSAIIEDETVESALKDAAQVSMGTEISELDIIHIKSLAEQVLSLTDYRSQLYEYLKNRMNAIAPNLTILLGELVGARLISHAGSLINLAKQPASTIQILGAEKALFRALKTKHDTPKYGLIYHASLIGQAQPKHKGKISRVLAAKAALAVRYDALSDDTAQETDVTLGLDSRAKVEARLRQLQGAVSTPLNKDGALTAAKAAKYSPAAAKAASTGAEYDTATDIILEEKTPEKASKRKKRKAEDIAETPAKEEGAEEEDDKAARKAAKKARKEKRKSKGGDDEDEDKAAKKAAKKAKKEKRKSKD